jgi:hypothetical protein
VSNGEPQSDIFSAPGSELVAVPTVQTAVEIDAFTKAAVHLQMFEKLREVALKMTRPHDWHFFGDKPWPQRGAVEKISRALGLSLELQRQPDGTPYTKRMAQDELGGYYIITVSGKIRGQWGDLEAVGFTSSRDQFFAADGRDDEGNIVYKPLSQVKEENIIQAAYTNFVANAVSRYVGLSSYTREDLEKVYGKGTVSGHAYKESKAKTTTESVASSTSDMKRLWAICLVMSDGLESEAQSLLAQMSQFTGKDGKVIAGLRDVSKLSPGRLTNTLRTAEKWWKEFLDKNGDQAGFYADLLQKRLAGGE